MDGMLRLERVQAVLQDFAGEIAPQYRENLLSHDRKASGRLLDSISVTVETSGTVVEVRMRLEEYWKYVEEGTRPHWPPRDAILRWIEVKPVIPRPGSDGRITTPKPLAFLISRKIAQEGTKGSHDLRDARETVMERFRERLSDALREDMQESFIGVVRVVFGNIR